eukprot:4879377-Amphidinium_carterae.1
MNPGDALQAVEDYWDQFWFDASKTSTDRFFEQFGHADLPEQLMPPLTVDDLETALRELTPEKAAGADGTRVVELHAMSPALQAGLLAFYQRAEAEQAWPQSICVQKVVFLAKPGKRPTPSTIRPIVLLPLLYRLWARMRTGYLREVFLNTTSGQVLGVRPHVQIQRVIMTMAIQLQQSDQQGLLPQGLHSDLTKAYEGIEHGVVKRTLTVRGVHKRLVSLVHMMYGLPASFSINKLIGLHTTEKMGIYGYGCVKSGRHSVSKEFTRLVSSTCTGAPRAQERKKQQSFKHSASAKTGQTQCLRLHCEIEGS